jgi:ketosteroid isomerase-like protein
MTIVETQAAANRALMADMYASAVAGDFPAVLACLADDLVVHEPGYLPYGGVYRGVEAFAAMIPKVMERLDLAAMTVDRLIAEGDRVFGVIRMPDRRTGDDILLAEESLIRDGKVVEITVYYNDAQSMVGG